jgi:hypothetical protein
MSLSTPRVVRRVATAAACTLLASSGLTSCRDKLDEDGHFEMWIASHPFTDATLVEAKSEHHSFAYESRSLHVVIDVPGLADWGDEDDWARVARARDEVCNYPTQDPETSVLTYLNRFGTHRFHGLDGNGKGDDGVGSLGISCTTDVPALLKYIATIWRLPHVTAQDQLGSYGDADLLSDWFEVDDIAHLDEVAATVVAAAAEYDPADRPQARFSVEGRLDLLLGDMQGHRPADLEPAMSLARTVWKNLPRGYLGAVAVNLDGKQLPDMWDSTPGAPPWYLSCGSPDREACPWRYEIAIMHKDSAEDHSHDPSVRRVITDVTGAISRMPAWPAAQPQVTFGGADDQSISPIDALREEAAD